MVLLVAMHHQIAPAIGRLMDNFRACGPGQTERLGHVFGPRIVVAKNIDDLGPISLALREMVDDLLGGLRPIRLHRPRQVEDVTDKHIALRPVSTQEGQGQIGTASGGTKVEVGKKERAVVRNRTGCRWHGSVQDFV